eukprot:14791275-Ditylum_brightwellii.AAC.1
MRDALFKQKLPATSPTEQNTTNPLQIFLQPSNSYTADTNDTYMATMTQLSDENSTKIIKSLHKMYPEQDYYITELQNLGLSVDQIEIS